MSCLDKFEVTKVIDTKKKIHGKKRIVSHDMYFKYNNEDYSMEIALTIYANTGFSIVSNNMLLGKLMFDVVPKPYIWRYANKNEYIFLIKGSINRISIDRNSINEKFSYFITHYDIDLLDLEEDLQPMLELFDFDAIKYNNASRFGL